MERYTLTIENDRIVVRNHKKGKSGAPAISLLPDMTLRIGCCTIEPRVMGRLADFIRRHRPEKLQEGYFDEIETTVDIENDFGLVGACDPTL